MHLLPLHTGTIGGRTETHIIIYMGVANTYKETKLLAPKASGRVPEIWLVLAFLHLESNSHCLGITQTLQHQNAEI